MSLPPEIQKKVKLLELNTRKLVNNIFAGEYHSAFKGQGMTFSEFREYVPGDDVRAISWTVTAKTGKPFIKIYDEERDHNLMLLVDISGSTDFGTGTYLKGEALAHLAALLSFSAVRNGDAVGLLLFSDQVEHYVPPKKGRGQVLRILRDLYYFKPKSRQTQLSSAFEYLSGVLKKRASLFIFSDFMDQGFEKSLSLIAKKHDVTAVILRDPFELQLPAMGLVEFEDSETGEITVIDTSAASLRENYQRQKQEEQKHCLDELKRAQVDSIEVNTNEDIVNPLVAYFKRRKLR